MSEAHGKTAAEGGLGGGEAAPRAGAVSAAALVYGVIFFSFLDLFSQLPIMSTFAQSLGASLTLIGVIVGMYSFANIGGNLLAGVMADRWGAFGVLVAGLLGTTILLASYSVVETPYALLAVRFFHGLIGGFIVPAAFTYIANENNRKESGRMSASTGALIGSAAIVGPAFGGIMAANTSPGAVFMTVGVFGAVLCLGVLVFLRRRGVSEFRKRTPSLASARNRSVFFAVLGAFLLMFSQGALAYLLPLRVAEFGLSSSASGMLLSVFGVVAVLFFILPTKRIYDRIPPVRGLQAGMLLLGLSQLALSAAGGQNWLYAIMVMYGIGFAFIYPSMNILLIRGTEPGNRGKAYGILYAFFSIGVVAGSSGLGTLPLDISGMFAATGALLLAGFLSCFLHREPPPAPARESGIPSRQ